MLEVGAILRDLGLGLGRLGAQDDDLRLGHILLVQSQLIGFLGIFQSRGGHHTFLGHADGTFIGPL